jgi:hypothetical protein
MIHAFSSSVRQALVRWPSLLFVLIGCLTTLTARAQDDDPGGSPSPVVYAPNMVISLQGVAPLNHSYQLTVTSPGAYPSGVRSLIELSATVQGVPAGISAADAAGFVTFAPRVVEFTGPGQVQAVTVNVSIPTGSEDGAFKYWITSGPWPTNVGIVDNGTYINMVVTPPTTFPAASVTVDSPANGATYTHVLGQPAIDIPITATGKAGNSNPVDEVTVTVAGVDAAGTAIAIPTVTWNPSGAGSAQEVVSTLFPASVAGRYTITATARDHLGGTATATSTFTVNETVPPPVVILTQAPAVSYDYYLGAPALQIPFAFQGVSLRGSIQTLTATLNNVPVAFTPAGVGALTATGTGTLNVSAGGDYVLVVTATTEHGTGTATAEFRVNALVPATFAVHGSVFFDVNSDGHRQAFDFGLPGLSVTLTAANGTTTTTKTGDDGLYSFEVKPGTYRVAVQPVKGFDFSTARSWTVTVASAPVTVPDCGLIICFNDLWTMRADGCTIGFWKNNVGKALAGKGGGAQISPAKISAYTTGIAALALEPFDGLTPAQALSGLSSNSPAAKDLLAKQLLAAEYNYENGAFIGGNAVLTYAFVYWGEYTLKNASSLSRGNLLDVKDWMEAYNSSHGWVVLGPLLWSADFDQHCDGGNDDHHRDSHGDDDRDDSCRGGGH